VSYTFGLSLCDQAVIFTHLINIHLDEVFLLRVLLVQTRFQQLIDDFSHCKDGFIEMPVGFSEVY
jgi:hypothetical protein